MRSEITTIIFSKNRACQLELLLRSLQQFQYKSPVSVLYTYDPELKAGYDKLIKMYPKIKFIKETNFWKQVIELVENSDKYVMFMVDDDIMIDFFNEDCPEFKEFKRNPDIICLTLRMAPYQLYAPEFVNNTWKWRGHKKGWGYPMSVTSHIFRKDDITPIIDKKGMANPNHLEVRLRKSVIKKETLCDKKLMLCFDKPKTINNLANQVQTEFLGQNAGISVKYLEKRFLGGERLSLADVLEKSKKTETCFIKTDFKWENNK